MWHCMLEADKWPFCVVLILVWEPYLELLRCYSQLCPQELFLADLEDCMQYWALNLDRLPTWSVSYLMYHLSRLKNNIFEYQKYLNIYKIYDSVASSCWGNEYREILKKYLRQEIKVDVTINVVFWIGWDR